MGYAEKIIESAIRKENKTLAVKRALNRLHAASEQPEGMFNIDNPLARMPHEMIHAHKAFMDFILYGASNFSYWLRFRFPEQAKMRKHYAKHAHGINPGLAEKLGDGGDWIHLASLKTAEMWRKLYLWEKRSQRSYDMINEKLIKQTEEVQLEVKKEQLQKVVGTISELAMAIVSKTLRAKLKEIEDNPNRPIEETMRDIKALAELGINSHPLLKEAKAEKAQKEKVQVNVQNNYNFNKEVAQQIHGSIKDLE